METNHKQRVFGAVKNIPRGKVSTYGQIAKIVEAELCSTPGVQPRFHTRCGNGGNSGNNGKKIDARIVGWMLHLNTSADVPCHRVVDRNGRLAPNFAGPAKSTGLRSERSGAVNGASEQRRRLEAEGVRFVDEKHVDLDKCLWSILKGEEVKVRMPV